VNLRNLSGKVLKLSSKNNLEEKVVRICILEALARKI
jgi:hypothetical protein